MRGKSMDWFLHDNRHRHERVKPFLQGHQGFLLKKDFGSGASLEILRII